MELLAALVQHAAATLEASPLPDEADVEPKEKKLPPPIIPGNFERRAPACLMNVSQSDSRCLALACQGGCLWREELLI